jgi:hypothetical protein
MGHPVVTLRRRRGELPEAFHQRNRPQIVVVCTFWLVGEYHRGVADRLAAGDADRPQHGGDIMADDASGDAAPDEAVALDDPTPTDPLAVVRPDDYRLEDADDPASDPTGAYTGGIAWSETDWSDGGHPGDRFDAFDANTWNFKSAPKPWYDSTQAKVGIAAVGLALVTLVVSVVLLAFGTGSSGESDAPPAPTSDAPTTTVPTTTPSSALPPPHPPPPPPPPPPSEAPSAPVYQGPRYDPRPSKKPEINVTRSPMSVSPQKPSNR